MYRGSATTDGGFAYFTPAGCTSVYQYEYSTEEWEELPACPCRDSGLVTIDRELTAVGGQDGSYPSTNKLYTLRQRKWVEKYPRMNTARDSPAVVSTSDGEHLIVIVGFSGGGYWTATVELFQVKSRRSHQLTDLPQPLSLPSATICGDQLNVIGRDANGYILVFSFLSTIQRSTNHITSHPILEASPSPTSGTLNSCHSLWTASSHWWLPRSVSSQLHTSAGGWGVGEDWLYGWW